MEQNQIEDDSEKAESPLKPEEVAAIAVSDGVVLEEEVIHEQQPPPQYQNLIIQHMDIAEPLSTLKRLLEIRLQCSLAEHNFYLQDTILLDSSKSLVDQCVQGEGMVQINLEVKSQPGTKPKINILDILKPAEEVIVPPNLPDPAVATTQTIQPQATKVVIPLPEESENVTRWIVDQNFRREQERLKIPHDPCQWSEVHVRHWIQWAVREFQLEGVDINQFRLSGRQLCDLQHDDFVKYIPFDRNDIFWTHLELLRKCKFVAVLQQPTPHAITTITVSTSDGHSGGKILSKTPRPRFPRITGEERITPGNRTVEKVEDSYCMNNVMLRRQGTTMQCCQKYRSSNNGQIQLWQFLLELLTDKEYRDIIQWVGDDGEFKLHNPEMVAQLWGQRKNKPTMNYEKLSRALRYYYDGDMIAKVHGKRFVYRFVCDLKMLLGYSSRELSKLIPQSCDKKVQHIELVPHCLEKKLQHLPEEPLLTTITMKRVDQKTQTV